MNVQILEIAGQRMAVLPEGDFQQLTEMAEENADIQAAILAEQRAKDGEEYVPFEVVERLVNDESPLRVWRQYRGLSQRALGEKIGLSKMTISGLETGKRDTNSRNWRLLAEALSIDLDDIIPIN